MKYNFDVLPQSVHVYAAQGNCMGKYHWFCVADFVKIVPVQPETGRHGRRPCGDSDQPEGRWFRRAGHCARPKATAYSFAL
jgi:hypothetical protein